MLLLTRKSLEALLIITLKQKTLHTSHKKCGWTNPIGIDTSSSNFIFCNIYYYAFANKKCPKFSFESFTEKLYIKMMQLMIQIQKVIGVAFEE